MHRPGSWAAQQLAWPFVGRDEELAIVAAQRRAGSCRAVVVSGAAGVGKTRLARELVAASAAGGAVSEWVQGTRAATSIPLGVFTGLVPPRVGPGDPGQLFHLCADTLRERAAATPLVLGADDAHLLDMASAALVLHMAMGGAAFVVVTVRSGEPCPDPIVALWKDAGALRLELQQLSEEETAGLLAAALGGEVGPDVLRWAFAVSEGNVLYLRELVAGALESGALEQVSGRWQLSFRPRPSHALIDLISARLAGLSDEELATARLLALGEPLAVGTLARVTATAALSGLEDKGLAIVRAAAAADGEARLAHPLYAEVLRATTPTLRAASLRQQLAESVQAGGMLRPGDALKVVTWLDEAGVSAEPPTLLAAAREANAASDPDLADRLATRAAAAGGVEAALILASAHALRRRFAEAEDLLASLEGQLVGPQLAAAYLAERAMLVLHLGLRRTGEALGLLARARGWFTGPAWHARVAAIELEVRATGAGSEPGQLIEAAGQVLRRADLHPQVRRRTSIAYAFSLHQVGRTAEARAMATQLRPGLPLRDDDDVYAMALWPLVCLESGYDWDAVEAWLGEAVRAAEHGDEPLTRGQALSWLGAAAIVRGRPATAARLMREAIPSLMRRDPLRRLPGAWLGLAVTASMQGDAGAAREALARYHALIADGPVPYLQPQQARAEAALATAEGKTSQAGRMLLQEAAAQQAPADRGYLLYEALRSGADPRVVAPGLRAAASSSDAPLTGVFAQQAAALSGADGPALADAACALGEIGGWMWAAEAAAQAAAAYTSAGRNDSARRALALSASFLAKCEDLRSPALAGVRLAAAELTAREREIVDFASHGATNAQIAEELVLSIRTVESHLYHAMLKLGARTRQELRILAAEPPTPDVQ